MIVWRLWTFLTIRVFRIFDVYIDKYNRQFSYDFKGCGGLKAMYMHEYEIHVKCICHIQTVRLYLVLPAPNKFRHIPTSKKKSCLIISVHLIKLE